MLQKLSKCEVKACLCWNLIILPPLRFYGKSSFGKFKRSKNVIFLLSRNPLHVTITQIWWKRKTTFPLCSRNFQNVKLRLVFVEIRSFYLHCTQILREIKFWWIQTVQKCHLWQFSGRWTLNFAGLSQIRICFCCLSWSSVFNFCNFSCFNWFKPEKPMGK